MKKTIAIILMICLGVAVLCACGGDSTATDGNAAVTDGNAAVTDGNARTLPADNIPTEPDPTDAPTPEPPATFVDAPTVEDGAVAADAELSALLLSVRDDYHPGTAGSSLTCLRLAAEIMDWYAAQGSVGVAYETVKSLGDPGADPAGTPYADKLEEVYAAAVSLYGSSGATALADSGYVPVSFPYEMRDVREVFDALYGGLGYGAGAPVYVRTFRSDDNAERFLVSGKKVGTLSPENVIQSLKDMDVLAEDVAIQGMYNMENNGLLIDLNAAFLDQLRSMGTTGEYMIMGALVNTFLQNYSADSLLITVDGVHPESGHVYYDFPMTMYPDNVAMG